MELEYPIENGDGGILWATNDVNAYALKCSGDSMSPRIKHGEFVIIEPNHEVQAGDEVVVKDLDGRVMIKQFTYIRDGMYYFSSINEAYAPFGILAKDMDKMHYVAGIAKSALLIT